MLGGRGAGSDVKESDNLGQSDGTYGKISSPGLQDLRSWQQLVSLWDRMEDPRVILHEAPSAFEIVAPACEGWVLLRRKTGVFIDWKRQWAVLKRSHLLLFDRPDSPRPSSWALLRHSQLVVKSEFSGKDHADAAAVGKAIAITLQHRRKLVFTLHTRTDLDRWRMHLCDAIARAKVDARASRPLPCTPLVVKERALSGVPDCFRGVVWFKLSGADVVAKKHASRYKTLLRMKSPHDERIMRDLNRTMPSLDFFRNKETGGQQLLFNVAHAYAVHDPEVGYSQGLNFLVAVLLLHMREEQAFWVLVQLMRRYRMRGIFRSESPQLAVELFKFNKLLQRTCPALHRHLTEEGVEMSMFMSEWALTLFACSFPLDFSFRVWDAVFVRGFSFIHQLSVALLRVHEAEMQHACFEDIIFLLRAIPESLKENKQLMCSVLAAAHDVAWDSTSLEEEAEEYWEECQRKDAEEKKEEEISKEEKLKEEGGGEEAREQAGGEGGTAGEEGGGEGGEQESECVEGEEGESGIEQREEEAKEEEEERGGLEGVGRDSYQSLRSLDEGGSSLTGENSTARGGSVAATAGSVAASERAPPSVKKVLGWTVEQR